jgi:hypothetical protein
VLQGERSEREGVLEDELAQERAARKKAETDAAYALNEARRLKELQKGPTPAKPKKTKSQWTFFDAED